MKFISISIEKLQIVHWTDWYKVSSSQINENGGAGLLLLYQSSPVKALMAIYPGKDDVCRFELKSINRTSLESLEVWKSSDWFLGFRLECFRCTSMVS